MRKYKVGDRIKIVCMRGEPNYFGKVGIVEHIDDLGQLHGTWGVLTVQPENGEIEVVGGAE